MIRAVIFDMDGVLVDNSKVHDETWRIMCEKYGKPESAEKVKSIFGGTNKIFVEQLLGITEPNEINRIAKEKEALYREVFQSTIKAPEGLLSLLFQLRKRNIRLAVATSGPKENLDFVLDNLEIRHFFDVLVEESQIKHGKPDPEIYLRAAQLLHLEPYECVAIEDSIFGLQSAKKAGMKAVAITTSFTADKLTLADKIINNFSELDVDELLNL
ncbi:MAG: HAD family phosphatase [Bacteroidales bacterium]|nr:HAD family phosphatase [Bacteroidales bacterium]